MTTFTVIISLMNKSGKKVTLLIGCLLLGLTLFAFGLANSIPKSHKYVFFGVCVVCRFIIGFGSACIGTASYAVIASNYPDKMATLVSVLNTVCTLGMISGTKIGTLLEHYLGYAWVYYCQGILVLAMALVFLMVYPYDPPGTSDDDEVKDDEDDSVSTMDIISNFNCLSVACTVICSMYCYSGKEPTISPIMEYYLGES